MRTSFWLTLPALINILYLPAFAGEILTVKGQKVILLIEEDETIRIHQRLSLTHPDTGSNTGIIEIIKKKNNKALAKILKGYARKGGLTGPINSRDDLEQDLGIKLSDNLTDNSDSMTSDSNFESESDSLLDEALTSGPKRKNTQRSPSSTDEDGPSNPFYQPEEEPSLLNSNPGHWGFGLGITPTTIKVSDEFGENTLKGNNFVVRIAYDKPLKKALSVLLGASLLPIAGTQTDDILGMAKVDANYLSLDANVRLSLFGTPMQGPWIGGGFNYLMANSASSNVISPKTMGSRSVFQLCAGINARMDNEYLAFRVDMLMHSKSGSSQAYVLISQYIVSATYFF